MLQITRVATGVSPRVQFGGKQPENRDHLKVGLPAKPEISPPPPAPPTDSRLKKWLLAVMALSSGAIGYQTVDNWQLRDQVVASSQQLEEEAMENRSLRAQNQQLLAQLEKLSPPKAPVEAPKPQPVRRLSGLQTFDTGEALPGVRMTLILQGEAFRSGSPAQQQWLGVEPNSGEKFLMNIPESGASMQLAPGRTIRVNGQLNHHLGQETLDDATPMTVYDLELTPDGYSPF